ncbi:MAG: Phospho-N-acetylmuramoyl-pentapeptide-transferase [Patescibacteria group bacterium]|nr:Phospho-N-acetylmuramoyl-pentapeptide-transferase [Patescibacteria group bacterium]
MISALMFTLLASFILTCLLAIPYIKLLYKYNIRRISKSDLDSVLPGRQIKLGSPIMGGGVILISLMLLSTLFLWKWEYYWLIILVSILGGAVGAIDEYTNTLGRTIKALRISKGESFFTFSGVALTAKKIILMPWKFFEENLRSMGSQQRGLKSHYKLLMHMGGSLIIVLFFYFLNENTHLYLLPSIYIDFGFLYYSVLFFALLFFANAFGVTDGMDGLSAGTHSVSFAFLGIIAIALGYFEVATLSFIIAGAELAFLYFNIYPARMEMSDVGTLPLGMFLVVIAFLINRESILLFVGLIYVIEILSSLLQVWSVKARGTRIFLIAPIHHHFEKLGWPETKVTTRFWLFNAISGILGIAIALL